MPSFTSRQDNLNDFAGARLGLFVHLGLYSLLERGEWVLNRERIDRDEYRRLADRFAPSAFDADDLARRAKDAGCRYLCFTTMHHDGFALYDSKVNSFNSVAMGPRRNLVREVVDACRKHDLRVHLYHSLNHWTTEPDGCDAMESEAARKKFVDFAHARVRELLELFNPIECLWYDGWWPFNDKGWRAEEMNAMALRIQPQLIFNGRNGLPGDFATPEQHITPPKAYRPWEACITHNGNWSYHAGDDRYKPMWQIIELVTQVAKGGGNLLLNVGPDASGRVPKPSLEILEQLGRWLKLHGEAIYGSEPYLIDFTSTDTTKYPADWMSHGSYTRRGKTLYAHLFAWPGKAFNVAGVEVRVQSARLLTTGQTLPFRQTGDRLSVSLPPKPDPLGGVVELVCDRPPVLNLCGGYRLPRAPYPKYDPVV